MAANWLWRQRIAWISSDYFESLLLAERRKRLEGSGRQSAPLKVKRSAPCTPGFCELKKTYHQGGTHTGMEEGVGPPPKKKTQRQMLLVVPGRHLCPLKGHQRGVSIQSLIHLGKTFSLVSFIWNTAPTWFLARPFAYLFSFISQILDFLYWMVSILIFDGVIVKTENKVYDILDTSYQSIQSSLKNGFTTNNFQAWWRQ